MHKQLQRLAMFTALTIGASALIVTPALAMPTAQDQDHHDQYQKDRTEHPEYVNNQFYQLGNKEGYEDHKKNLQRTEPQSQVQDPTRTKRPTTTATSRDGKERITTRSTPTRASRQ